MDSRNEIFSKSWKAIGWLVAIFVSVSLTQLIIRLPDPILIAECLLIIIILALTCFFILQSIKTIQDIHLMMTLDRIPYEIVQPILRKKLIFNSESLITKKCSSETFRVLKNNMEEDAVYNDFKIEYTSNDHVPKLNDITAYVDNDKVDLRRVSPQTCATYRMDETFSKTISTKYTEISFDVPVGIESGKERSLKVQFISEAFRKALTGQKDSLTLNCARITEKIIFEIRLDGIIQRSHRLSKCDEKDERRGGPLEFVIEDGSNQRMVTSEIELRKKKDVPLWADHKILWQIPNPKVNYNYTLYFTIKETRNPTVQEPLIIEAAAPSPMVT